MPGRDADGRAPVAASAFGVVAAAGLRDGAPIGSVVVDLAVVVSSWGSASGSRRGG